MVWYGQGVVSRICFFNRRRFYGLELVNRLPFDYGMYNEAPYHTVGNSPPILSNQQLTLQF